jgi:hypothetical protein
MVFICRHLCFLLLLSCHLDDLPAIVTPDPDDDVLAAENDDFLPSCFQHQSKLFQPDEDLPGSHPLALRPTAASTPGARPVSSPPPEPHGTSLLYCLMSLQR